MIELNDLNDSEMLLMVLGKIAPLSEPLKRRLSNSLRKECPSKKHLLLRPGDISRRIYFIAKGLARAYFVDHEGKEKTTWFMGTGDVMISVFSFFTRQPAAEYIELLEDSLLLSVNWRQLQGIYHDFPEFNLIGRILTEKYYILSEERMILLRMRKPENRYKLFLKNYAPILQKVPQHLIASFLELTPETLSRVRSKEARLITINNQSENSATC
jgi:CRP-like cAMP-binding protein